MKRYLSLVCAASLIAAACGGSGNETRGEPAVDQPDAVDAADREPATPGEGEGLADPDGTFTVIFTTGASSLYDPHTTPDPYADLYMQPTYDALFSLEAGGELEPMLATAHEFSEDLLTLTLTLRDGVVFHDGSPFDAEAVKANIERIKSEPTAQIAPDVGAVESVEVVDPLTVRFKLSAPDTALPALLAGRAGMMISPEAFDNEDLTTMAVGAGPYRVVEHRPGELIRYERFDDYWDEGVPAHRTLEILMDPDADNRLRAVQSGRADYAPIDADQISRAEATGLRVESRDLNALFVGMLKAEGPLRDPNVRRALSHAIDRDAIVEALFAGSTCTATGQLPRPWHMGYSDDVDDDWFVYDPDRARQLLEDAGAQDLSLEAIVLNTPAFVAIVEALQAQLGDVGVTVNVTPVEPAQLRVRFVFEKTADLYVVPYPIPVDPAKTVNQLLLEDSPLNPGGVELPGVEELAREGVATTDREEREQIYRQIFTIAAENALPLPICGWSSAQVYGPRVLETLRDLGGTSVTPDYRRVTVSTR